MRFSSAASEVLPAAIKSETSTASTGLETRLRFRFRSETAMFCAFNWLKAAHSSDPNISKILINARLK